MITSITEENGYSSVTRRLHAMYIVLKIHAYSSEFIKTWIDQRILKGLGYLSLLPHWGRNKKAAVSQTMFSNAFSFMKMFAFWLDISLKVVPKGPINNIAALIQVMAWRRSGDKPLSEPMMVRLPTHISFTRPQRVNTLEQVSDTVDFVVIWYLSTWPISFNFTSVALWPVNYDCQ